MGSIGNLPTFGLVSVRLSRDDYQAQRARKAYVCEHMAPNAGRRLGVPCRGGIQPGEVYVRTRQTWLEYLPVNVECLIDAGFVRRLTA